MQKIVVDTNVFVSALIQKSFPYLIIKELFVNPQIKFCISDELFSEYYQVLNRNKFANYPDFINNAGNLLTEIKTKSLKFNPKVRLTIIDDLDDNKLLELADESKANFLITGNTNDFTMQKYKRTKIVSPKEYWEKHLPK